MRIPDHYDSIDAPVYVWNKIHETGDFSWLLVKRRKLTKSLRPALEKIWTSIYDEYIKEFGFSERFIAIKQKEIEIAKMQLELILTGDRSLRTFIKIEQQQLEEMNQGNSKSNFMQSKIAIEKHFKFQINTMTTSIREYYSYLKEL